MTDEQTHKRLKAVAKALQQKANQLGLICVLRDVEGKCHVLPGHDFEVVGIYGQGSKVAEIAEDLDFCQVER